MIDKQEINRLFFLISGVYLGVKRNVEAKITPCNLTFAQYGVLSIAGARQLETQKSIADALDTDTTNIMVIVDSLEKKGYVTRAVNPHDRRSKAVRPTPLGLEQLKTAAAIVDAYREELISQLGYEDVSGAISILDAMYDFVKGAKG